MALFLYGACATAYALLAALLFVQSRRSRTGRRLLACCAITALWAAAWAVSGAVSGSYRLHVATATASGRLAVSIASTAATTISTGPVII